MSTHAIVLSVVAAVTLFPLLWAGWSALLAAATGGLLAAARGWTRLHMSAPRARLVDRPVRHDLGVRVSRFAETTRCLIVSLDHATRRAVGWRDGTSPSMLTRWLVRSRDRDYRPTNGMTSEVWSWLRSAEELAELDEPDADRIAGLAAAVREALFRDGTIVTRLAEIVGHLVLADTEFRSAGASHPYRGTTAAFLAPVLGADPEESGRFDRAMVEQRSAIEAVARRYAHDDASREDLAQEIRLAVWKAIPHFRGDSSLKTYVARIAHYRGVSFARRHRPVAPLGECIDPSPGAEEVVDDCRRRRALVNAIGELPSSQREALVLQLEGLTHREIARKLGVPDGTSSARITRARQALRRRLLGGC